MFSLLLIIAKGHVNWKSITQIMTHFHTIKVYYPSTSDTKSQSEQCKLQDFVNNWKFRTFTCSCWYVLEPFSVNQCFTSTNIDSWFKGTNLLFLTQDKVSIPLAGFLSENRQSSQIFQKETWKIHNKHEQEGYMGHINDLSKKTNRKQFLYQIYKNCGPFHKNSYEWFWS